MCSANSLCAPAISCVLPMKSDVIKCPTPQQTVCNPLRNKLYSRCDRYVYYDVNLLQSGYIKHTFRHSLLQSSSCQTYVSAQFIAVIFMSNIRFGTVYSCHLHIKRTFRYSLLLSSSYQCCHLHVEHTFRHSLLLSSSYQTYVSAQFIAVIFISNIRFGTVYCCHLQFLVINISNTRVSC